jgi:hypothetical protein
MPFQECAEDTASRLDAGSGGWSFRGFSDHGFVPTMALAGCGGRINRPTA